MPLCASDSTSSTLLLCAAFLHTFYKRILLHNAIQSLFKQHLVSTCTPSEWFQPYVGTAMKHDFSYVGGSLPFPHHLKKYSMAAQKNQEQFSSRQGAFSPLTSSLLRYVIRLHGALIIIQWLPMFVGPWLGTKAVPSVPYPSTVKRFRSLWNWF